MIDFLFTPVGATLFGAFVVLFTWYFDRMTALVTYLIGTVKGSKPDTPPPAQLEVKSGQPIRMMTEADFQAELERKAAAVEEALQTASEEDRAQLLAQKAEVERRLADVEGTLREREAKIAELTGLLRREGNEIGGDRLQHAIDALERGDFSQADEIFAEIEARDQPAVDRTARAAFSRGEIAEEQIRWLDAAEHYKRAATLAPDYDRLYKAGEFLWRAGRSGEAARFNEDLVALSKREHGEEAAETATALNNLAESYRTLGRYEEAEPLYRQAIEISESTTGTARPQYATSLNNLANLLRDMGRYEEAEQLFRQAIEISAATIGAAHPEYATHLNNLALLLKAMGRYEEAEPLLRQAIEIIGQSIGTKHPNYSGGLNNLAKLFQEMGRFDEAKPLYDQAVAIFEDRLGAEHPNTIHVKTNREKFRAARAAAGR